MAPIDLTDFRLLDAVRKAPLAGASSLAKACGLTASTARRRISALQAAGVIHEIVALPAPNVVGMHGRAGTWEATVSAAELLDLPGTIMAGNSIAGGTLAGGYSVEENGWLEAAKQHIGAAPMTTMALPRYDGPTLGPLHFRTLRAVVQEPHASAPRLAELSGLSVKTVRKYREAMLQSGAIKPQVLIRTGQQDDLVYHLHVSCNAHDGRAVMATILHGGEVSAAPQNGPIFCAFVRAETMRQQAKTLAAVRALNVGPVEVVHENEWEINKQHLLGFVDAQLERWGR